MVQISEAERIKGFHLTTIRICIALQHPATRSAKVSDDASKNCVMKWAPNSGEE